MTSPLHNIPPEVAQALKIEALATAVAIQNLLDDRSPSRPAIVLALGFLYAQEARENGQEDPSTAFANTIATLHDPALTVEPQDLRDAVRLGAEGVTPPNTTHLYEEII